MCPDLYSSKPFLRESPGEARSQHLLSQEGPRGRSDVGMMEQSRTGCRQPGTGGGGVRRGLRS